MKKIMKKRYLILGIILLLILSLTIFLVKYRKSKLETAKMETNTNSISPTMEENVNDEKVPNIIDTNVVSKQSDTLENTTQEIVKETTKDVLTEEKQQEKSKESKQQKTQETVPQKNEAKPIEITVSSTNDKTSKVEISTPVETEPEPKPKQEQPAEIVTPPTENAPTNEIISKPSIPEDTIKRISDEELTAETERFLRDIQSIKPGLTYKNVKRGQVFWPYRTSEIEIAVGGMSFGIVYYYVDIFIEDNQEKFKYYIDWAGNE